MQHLDDGTIHALLDGELTAEEAEALSEHVRYCAACADRLAEERLIQSEAERMIAELDAPAPAAAEAPMPPGNEALEPPLAPEQPKYSGPPVVLIPEREYQRSRIPRLLGWAATLIVAAGAGWFASVARQSAPSPIMLPEIQGAPAGAYLADSAAGFADSDAMAKSTGPADSAAAGASTALQGDDSARAPLIVEESESERDPAAVTAAPPPAPAETREDSRREAPQRSATGREPVSAPVQTARQRAAADEEVAQSDAARREAAADRVEPPAPAPAPAVTGAAAARAAPTPSTPSALEQQSQIRMRLGLDETQRMLGSGLHVIEGLQQQFVGLVDGRLVAGANPNAPVVRVVYLDDQRRPIYLDQQRLDGARRQMGLARDTVPPDWVKGDVWLSVKGSGLSASELAELARRVR
jgi:anti-sigma factor RsiW